MQRCSKKAYAMCQTRHLCGTIEEATFTDDSECAAFNKAVEDKPMTNADRIRAMSDEGLAKEILFFCPTDTVFKGEDTYGKPHYTGLDGGYYATSEEVVASNLEWLKQPAEGNDG